MAEDNEINRQIAVEMLGLLGAEVETAENGRAAVDAVLSHPPLYYDMVFMDIQMPVMNGYDAAPAIIQTIAKAAFCTAPIIPFPIIPCIHYPWRPSPSASMDRFFFFQRRQLDSASLS